MIVVHCRDPHDIYIGRPGKWGNPFSDGLRADNIARYREWLPTQRHLIADLHELWGKRLGCWCAPKACHGYVLAEFAIEDWFIRMAF